MTPDDSSCKALIDHFHQFSEKKMRLNPLWKCRCGIWSYGSFPFLICQKGSLCVYPQFVPYYYMFSYIYLQYYSLCNLITIHFLINAGSCDLFHGKWVPDSSGPDYTNNSCRFIETPQNCMTNGRPDSGYLYWRWKPYGCEMSRFEGEKFLEAMRGKHWALIGDSILRNHVQSLLCLLAKVFCGLCDEVFNTLQFRKKNTAIVQ